jgi:putative toxin-antitoxin system antitoxin component (TIGR02293 family)
MARTKPIQDAPTHPLAELLGRLSSTLELETEVSSEMELASLIAAGLPNRSIAALIRRGIPEKDIFRRIIPRRTYYRRLAENARLTPEESDRVERAARLLALATLVFDDEERATRWLSAPKRRFDGKSPLDVMGSTVGARLVEDVLLRSYFGLVA